MIMYHVAFLQNFLFFCTGDWTLKRFTTELYLQPFLFYISRQGFIKLPMLALDRVARIIGVCHQTWLVSFFLVPGMDPGGA